MKKQKLNVHQQKRINDIYETKDYSIFSYDGRNREIKPLKVKRLVKSMTKNGFLNQPIKITPDGIVIDGQHRLEAAKIVGVPVFYFIDRSGIDVYDNMALTNTHSNPWSKLDHIHGLSQKGLPHYQHLVKFMSDYPDFNVTESLMLMSNGFTSVHTDKFKLGQWKHKDLNVARMWANNLMKLKPYFKDGFNKSLFVRAMVDIFSKHPEFSFDEFLKKVQLRPGSIYLCGSVLNYKILIEDIYNYRRKNSEKINLRF